MIGSKTLNLRVTIDIEYDRAGLNKEDLVSMAYRAVRRAMGNGDFTGLSDATVEGWSCKVEKVEHIGETR